MSKILICRCEDVLLLDIEDAIRSGHDDIESLKRYTGFGTGVCQGKSCVAAVARVLWERTSVAPSLITAFTPRPPLWPLPMRLLAAPDAPDAPDAPEVPDVQNASDAAGASNPKAPHPRDAGASSDGSACR